MEKVCLNKKSLQGNQMEYESVSLSRTSHFKEKKFYPSHRLIYEEKDYKHSRVKRRHHINLRIDCNSTYFYIRNPNGLLKLQKESKHIKSLELHALLFSHRVSLAQLYKLVRKLSRLSSVRLYFGTVYLPQSKAEIQRIRTICSKIRANLNAFSTEIYLGTGANIIVSWLARTIIDTLQPMSHLKSFCMNLPKLGSRLGTIFQQQEDPRINDEKLIKLYTRKFQRLRKLQDIQLPFLASEHPILTSFTKRFSHLNHLTNLEVLSYSTAFGRNLSQDLKCIKTLRTLIIYKFIDPSDLLSILFELPNLKKFVIKDKWLFTRDLNLLEDIIPGEISVTNLEFDFPMDVTDEEEAKLFSSFLGFFYKLTSLKIYICCEESTSVLEPLAKAINRLQGLNNLTLGVFLKSPKALNVFLKLMNNFTKLQKLSLMLKLSFGSTWDQSSHLTFKTLENFLLKNIYLQELELFWEKFSPKCMEYLREIMKKLPALKLFKLAYISVYKEHGQVHNEIISMLVKALKEVQKIGKIAITTSCPTFLYESCEKKARDVKKIPKQIYFETTTPVSTPFYNDNLMF